MATCWRRFLTKLLKVTLWQFFVVVRSFTADSNLLQPTESVNTTPHTSHFLVFHRTHFNVTSTLAQGSRCVARTSYMSHPHALMMWLFLTLCDSHFYSLLSTFSLIFLFILLFFTFFFNVEDKNPAHFCEWGLWHPGRERSSHNSQGESQLYIFEDNEAVITMIIEGRSPTRRRFRNPQRCAWLGISQNQFIFQVREGGQLRLSHLTPLRRRPVGVLARISRSPVELLCGQQREAHWVWGASPAPSSRTPYHGFRLRGPHCAEVLFHCHRLPLHLLHRAGPRWVPHSGANTAPSPCWRVWWSSRPPSVHRVPCGWALPPLPRPQSGCRAAFSTMPCSAVDPCSCVNLRKLVEEFHTCEMKVDSDLAVDSRSARWCFSTPLTNSDILVHANQLIDGPEHRNCGAARRIDWEIGPTSCNNWLFWVGLVSVPQHGNQAYRTVVKDRIWIVQRICTPFFLRNVTDGMLSLWNLLTCEHCLAHCLFFDFELDE